MFRRDFLSLLGGMTALGSITGCKPAGTLTIGIHPWPGYEPLYLAEHFRWLPSTVVLRNASSASESLAGLRDGTLDGAALTLDEVLNARAEGLPLSVILVMNESVGADVVLARTDIPTPAALRGRRIGVERSAVGGLVLRKLLAAGGLQEADVTLLDLPPPQQFDAWQEGRVDAVITYSPTDSLIERAGGQRIFDSRQFPGTIFDVLAVRSDRRRSRSSCIHELIRAHLRGLEHLRVSRDDATRRIAAWRGLSLDETMRTFAGLALPDLAQNRRMLAAGGSVDQAAADLADMLAIRRSVALDGLVDPGFLPDKAPLP
jgi:NitT/TauT family transport system substrate-binding protein